jgi:hypothetical protein
LIVVLDKAQRIAANIAKLPVLFGREQSLLVFGSLARAPS